MWSIPAQALQDLPWHQAIFWIQKVLLQLHNVYASDLKLLLSTDIQELGRVVNEKNISDIDNTLQLIQALPRNVLAKRVRHS